LTFRRGVCFRAEEARILDGFGRIGVLSLARAWRFSSASVKLRRFEPVKICTIDGNASGSSQSRHVLSALNRIRRVLVPVVLIAAVLATTTGMVWHQHHGSTSADHCMLCHLALAPGAPAAPALCEAASVPAVYLLKAKRLILRQTADQTAPRAPPV